jgi:hypothetical protein
MSVNTINPNNYVFFIPQALKKRWTFILVNEGILIKLNFLKNYDSVTTKHESCEELSSLQKKKEDKKNQKKVNNESQKIK